MNPRNVRVAAGLLLASAPLALTAACSETSTDLGGPLSISLSVDRTSGVAGVDAFVFRYEATGSELLGIVLDFGDEQADSLGAQGASQAGATRSHVYESAGIFSAIAEAQEARGARTADTVVVEVRAP